MIEFNGEMSKECREYILKREAKLGVICTLIVAIIFLIPILIATFLWDWIVVIAIIPLVMLVSFSAIRIPPKKYGMVLPTRISIDENTIISESEKFIYKCPISEVKKVVDMGEWYHIFFNFKYRNMRFVCQKNLLIEGSIEEFENLFYNKIKKLK